MIDRSNFSNDANVMLDAAIEILGDGFQQDDKKNIVFSFCNKELIIFKFGCVSLYEIDSKRVMRSEYGKVTIKSHKPIISSIRVDEVKRICEIFKEI